MATVDTDTIQRLLDESLIDFGSNHITLLHDVDEWLLTATYTTMGDSFTDCELYLGENEINLSDNQKDYICNYLKSKIDEEQKAYDYYKKMSCDDEYNNNGVDEAMFI
jgi:hypothetical protein